MGISVAKHRLEILKLAGKEQKGRGKKKQGTSKQRFLWLVFAAKQVKTNLGKWVRRREDAGGSLAIVSARNCSLRWKAAMLKRNKTVVGGNSQGRLMMLTNWGSRSSASASPEIKGLSGGGGGGVQRSPAVGDLKWDSMFQNLKPT
ncbi:unnamed protein product [Cuscuta campestris]|uniref:SAM domain-containing protein n=1 Tax=Cuscuta campestris TaxID=132261 RepID=A0A484MFK8_9ASTE|nr:unnamed protein product [Cuscuta campestris]